MIGPSTIYEYEQVVMCVVKIMMCTRQVCMMSAQPIKLLH